MDSKRREAWVEIDLGNLKHNINEIKKLVGGRSTITAIVKADAYGHGAVRISKALQEEGVTSFGVATLDEAIELRDAGINGDITVLGVIPDNDVALLLEYKLRPVICNFENAKLISAAAAEKGASVDAFVAVDTGMGRIGYIADAPETIDKITGIASLDRINIVGLFSHFATADEADKTFSKEQYGKYTALLEQLRKQGLDLPEQSLANSAAVMELPEAMLEIVRPGIILYGCYPSAEVDKNILSLRPVMSIKARIIHIKKVPAGFSCGYGRRFIAEKDSIIATLALGYADGFPRPYSSKARVIVDGVIAPVAGNICMDQCMVDVTDVPGVRRGDEVTIMGSASDANGETISVTADDIAAATGTISYEVLCAFGQRLPKVYI